MAPVFGPDTPPPRNCRVKKTRRKFFSRRAASFQFDPVLVTSWSPSHRGRAFSTISLNRGFFDVVQPEEI